MGQRSDLHQILKALLPAGKKVYFQPPLNIQMIYPCIVYEQDGLRNQFADDTPYRGTKRYQVTVIDEDPDSDINEAVSKLSMGTFNRFFTSADLNHFVYTIYF